MVDLSEYVQPKEAAVIIGCTNGRVYQMLRGGEFEETDLIRLGGRPRLISRAAVEKIASEPASTGRPRKNSA
jgi:hypothetical protein